MFVTKQRRKERGRRHFSSQFLAGISRAAIAFPTSTFSLVCWRLIGRPPLRPPGQSGVQPLAASRADERHDCSFTIKNVYRDHANRLTAQQCRRAWSAKNIRAFRLAPYKLG